MENFSPTPPRNWRFSIFAAAHSSHANFCVPQRWLDRLLSALAMLQCAALPFGIAITPQAAAQPSDEAPVAQDKAVDERLVARALAVPSADLGTAYLVSKNLVEFAGFAQGGIQIVTPEGKINERNAKTYLRRYQGRLAAYRQAIARRGYQSLAGTYAVASVTKACARSGSMLMGGTEEGVFKTIEIAQDGFEITLKLALELEDSEASADDKTLDTPGVVVESAVVVAEPLNSDYFHQGEFSSDRIELKPRLDVLGSWAGPPKKSDLENCTLVLERQDEESQVSGNAPQSP